MRCARRSTCVDFADDEVRRPRILWYFGWRLVDAHDDEIAVHRALHRLAVDEDVGLFAAAEDGAVAVGMHADPAGVIRRELEQRVAFAADGEDDEPSAPSRLDGALDLFAGTRRNAGVETGGDVRDRKNAVSPLAQQSYDCLSHIGPVYWLHAGS